MNGPEPEAASQSQAGAPSDEVDTSSDQARALLRTIPVGLAGSVIPAAVVAWILRDQASADRLLAWLAVLLAAHAGRIGVWLAARRDMARTRNARRWLLWLRASVFGLGLSWAVLPLIVAPGTPFDELLVASVVIAVCGAGVAQQSSDAPSALLFTLPSALVVCARLLGAQDSALRSVGGLSVLYFAYLTVATYRIQSSFLELSRMHAHASRRSLHDELTGLPNRHALHQRLQLALARARRNGTEVAVGYIDLDDFKQVNDRLGHDAGDALLREAARRWRQALRASEIVARLGGDEFAVVIEDIDPQRAALELGAAFSRIEAATATPIRVAPNELARLRMTMGVARYPVDANDMDMLLRQADIAMYQLKQRKATRTSWWQLGLHDEAAVEPQRTSPPASP